jgi:hypothetical protein
MANWNHVQKTKLGFGDWNFGCESSEIIYLNIFSASRHLSI